MATLSRLTASLSLVAGVSAGETGWRRLGRGASGLHPQGNAGGGRGGIRRHDARPTAAQGPPGATASLSAELPTPTLTSKHEFDLDGSLNGVCQDWRVKIVCWAEFATKDSSVKMELRDVDQVAVQPYLGAASRARVQRGALELNLQSDVPHHRLWAPGEATRADVAFAPTGTLEGTFMGVPVPPAWRRLWPMSWGSACAFWPRHSAPSGAKGPRRLEKPPKASEGRFKRCSAVRRKNNRPAERFTSSGGTRAQAPTRRPSRHFPPAALDTAAISGAACGFVASREMRMADGARSFP
jgi:hypothetical protein